MLDAQQVSLIISAGDVDRVPEIGFSGTQINSAEKCLKMQVKQGFCSFF